MAAGPLQLLWRCRTEVDVLLVPSTLFLMSKLYGITLRGGETRELVSPTWSSWDLEYASLDTEPGHNWLASRENRQSFHMARLRRSIDGTFWSLGVK